MRVQESKENYLEAILMLQQKQGYVRSVDVANHLNFSPAQRLRGDGQSAQSGAGDHRRARLSQPHRRRAGAGGKGAERHLLITEWLVGLGVSEETAAEDACRIEHVISQESFDCIRRHVDERPRQR